MSSRNPKKPKYIIYKNIFTFTPLLSISFGFPIDKTSSYHSLYLFSNMANKTYVLVSLLILNLLKYLTTLKFDSMIRNFHKIVLGLHNLFLLQRYPTINE